MTDADADVRIAPLRDDEMTDDQRELVDASGTPQLDIFRTLVRHPGLYRRWLPFAGKLLAAGKLSPRDRELVILRSAHLCRARYEWAQHVAIARHAGLADEEIRAIAEGSSDPIWNDGDSTFLRAVDEVIENHCISEATWNALEHRCTIEQLIELPMLAGHYAMLAGVLNSLGVQPESADLPALGDV